VIESTPIVGSLTMREEVTQQKNGSAEIIVHTSVATEQQYVSF
jgi:hypothetical protein